MTRQTLARSLLLKNKGIVPLFFLFASMWLCGCDPPGDSRLWIHNQSADTLYYYKSYDGSLPSKQPFQAYDYILPGENLNLKLGTGNLKQYIVQEGKGSLKIFSFRKRDVQNRSWLTILEQKLYHVSTFNIEEIERLNWHLGIPKKFGATSYKVRGFS